MPGLCGARVESRACQTNPLPTEHDPQIGGNVFNMRLRNVPW